MLGVRRTQVALALGRKPDLRDRTLLDCPGSLARMRTNSAGTTSESALASAGMGLRRRISCEVLASSASLTGEPGRYRLTDSAFRPG